MTYAALAVSLGLATFLVVDAVCSALVALVWRVARRDLDSVGARSRANGLFLLAVFPATAAAVVVFGVFLPAFFRFEPRETSEIIGETLIALAVVSCVFIVASLRRGWLASAATRRVRRRWLGAGRPVALHGVVRAYGIAAEFPVVSVVGIFRPQLFISERILRECTAEEVYAMVQHECGHLASDDNLKRLLLRMSPSLLGGSAAGRDLAEQWQEASEEAADDFAAAASKRRALALAHALLHVARMAPVSCGPMLPVTALYQGTSIERRVRRLVGAHASRGSRPAWLVAARVLVLVPPVLALVVLLEPRLLYGVYHVIEAVVEALP